MRIHLPLIIIYRNEVAEATNKVSANAQQGASSEAAAYTSFKRALIQGKVWVVAARSS